MVMVPVCTIKYSLDFRTASRAQNSPILGYTGQNQTHTHAHVYHIAEHQFYALRARGSWRALYASTPFLVPKYSKPKTIINARARLAPDTNPNSFFSNPYARA